MECRVEDEAGCMEAEGSRHKTALVHLYTRLPPRWHLAQKKQAVMITSSPTELEQIIYANAQEQNLPFRRLQFSVQGIPIVTTLKAAMLEARIDLEFIDYSLVPVEYAWKASAGTIEDPDAREPPCDSSTAVPVGLDPPCSSAPVQVPQKEATVADPPASSAASPSSRNEPAGSPTSQYFSGIMLGMSRAAARTVSGVGAAMSELSHAAMSEPALSAVALAPRQSFAAASSLSLSTLSAAQGVGRAVPGLGATVSAVSGLSLGTARVVAGLSSSTVGAVAEISNSTVSGVGSVMSGAGRAVGAVPGVAATVYGVSSAVGGLGSLIGVSAGAGVAGNVRDDEEIGSAGLADAGSRSPSDAGGSGTIVIQASESGGGRRATSADEAAEKVEEEESSSPRTRDRTADFMRMRQAFHQNKRSSTEQHSTKKKAAVVRFEFEPYREKTPSLSSLQQAGDQLSVWSERSAALLLQLEGNAKAAEASSPARNTSETSAALSDGDANDPDECMDALVATLALLDYELSQLLRAMKSVCLQLAKFPTNGDHEHRVKENLKAAYANILQKKSAEYVSLRSRYQAHVATAPAKAILAAVQVQGVWVELVGECVALHKAVCSLMREHIFLKCLEAVRKELSAELREVRQASLALVRSLLVCEDEAQKHAADIMTVSMSGPDLDFRQIDWQGRLGIIDRSINACDQPPVLTASKQLDPDSFEQTVGVITSVLKNGFKQCLERLQLLAKVSTGLTPERRPTALYSAGAARDGLAQVEITLAKLFNLLRPVKLR